MIKSSTRPFGYVELFYSKLQLNCFSILYFFSLTASPL